MILDSEILFSYPDPHEATTLGTTLLKEGYSLSLDDVYDICCQDHTAVGLTIYKNEDIVKTIKVKTGDYIYYNKTIGGREYAIIESKFDAHFWGVGDNIVRLKPFYQYSDGSNIVEPDFVTTNLNPKITEAPPEEWNRTFGGIYNDNGWSVQQTSDDGYILGGTIVSLNPGGPPKYLNNAWLIKVDVNGNEQWNKTFRDLYFRSVLHLHDDGYIFVGIKPTERSPTVLVKTDVNGNQQWSKSFFDLGDAQSIQQTSDGGFILAGKSYGANGNEQWDKTFGLDGFDRVYSVVQTSDGGYVLAGEIDTAKNPDLKGQIYYTDNDAWLFKTDANGTLEWSKTIGGLKSDEAKFVQQTSDGGYVIAGTTESYGSGGSDIWLVKVGGMKLDTTQSQVIISDNNVKDNNVQTSPGKSIPGFEFFGVVISVLIILLSRRRIL